MAYKKIENAAIKGISACVPEHVEENMRKPSVHEHVGDELPPVEEAGSRVEEREVAHHEIRANLSRYKDYYVDNEQVLGYRCGAEPASSAAEVLH